MPDWQALYERHSATVWKAAWRILRDWNGAADCVQETFLAVMSSSPAQPVREWEALLVSVAVRRALNQLRDRARRQSSAGAEEVRSLVPSPEQAVAATELAERLREALADLPERQAEVFCLRAFHDMSYQEIAGQLGIRDEHVGVLLHRARHALGRTLKDHCPPAFQEKSP